jgi:hypothetical protein
MTAKVRAFRIRLIRREQQLLPSPAGTRAADAAIAESEGWRLTLPQA